MKMIEDNKIEKVLGLDFDQSLILFSLQKALIDFDLNDTKDNKQFQTKLKWRENWEKGIIDFLSAVKGKNVTLLNQKDITLSADEIIKEKGNDLWLKMIAIEMITYRPYIVLDNEIDDNDYKKCNYNQRNLEKYLEVISGLIKDIKKNEVMECSNCLYEILQDVSLSLVLPSLKKLQNQVNVCVRDTVLSLMANDNALNLFGDGFKRMDAEMMLRSIMSLSTSGVIVDNDISDDEVLKICGGGLLSINNEKSMGVTQAELLNIPEFSLVHGSKLATVIINFFNNKNNEETCQEEISNYKYQMINFEKESIQFKYDVGQNDKIIEKMMLSLDYLRRIYKNLLNYCKD